MKIQTTVFCLALSLGLTTTVAVVGLTGCAGDRYNRSTGEYIDDKTVRLRVSSALSDNPDYKFAGVKVTAFKGTVQLSGFVDLSVQKSKAEDIAKGVQGVKELVNHITIKDQNEGTTGEYIDDKSVNSRVNSALNYNPDYKFDEVVVITSEGTVQLSGFVNTADQKMRAGEIAKGVAGVKNVVNNITVKDKL